MVFSRSAAAVRACAAAAFLGVTSLLAVCGSPSSHVLNGAPDEPWYFAALAVPMPPPTGWGKGELVALIDSGLDYASLPTLSPRVVSPWNQVTGKQDVSDDNGHGTEVAVVAAGGGDGGVWGLAPAAGVMPIKVTDADGYATPSAVAAAIDRAVTLHASVINLSLASEVPDLGITRAIQMAMASGVVVVAAAGDVDEAGAQFPASIAGVIAVYAQDQSGAPAERYNRPVGSAVMAPGIDVVTLVVSKGRISKKLTSGSSVATAFVSALIADCLGVQAEHGAPRERAITMCKARMVRSPNAPGFLNVRSILA